MLPAALVPAGVSGPTARPGLMVECDGGARRWGARARLLLGVVMFACSPGKGEPLAPQQPPQAVTPGTSAVPGPQRG